MFNFFRKKRKPIINLQKLDPPAKIYRKTFHLREYSSFSNRAGDDYNSSPTFHLLSEWKPKERE